LSVEDVQFLCQALPASGIATITGFLARICQVGPTQNLFQESTTCCWDVAKRQLVRFLLNHQNELKKLGFFVLIALLGRLASALQSFSISLSHI
jgi:hypothetical protein